MKTICYLRKGRKLRATGEVIWREPDGKAKVKPSRLSWGTVVVTAEEIAAGAEKPEYTPRKKPETETAPVKRERKPKPAPVPRWKELVAQVRCYEQDHHPTGWPAVRMSLLTQLADELEAAQSLFQSKP